MKKIGLILLISFCFSIPSLAGSHQDFLLKKGMLFDGWQDEGLLVVQKDIPKFKRMSTAELHRRVADRVALLEQCQGREIASDEAADEECLKFKKEW